MRLIDADKVSTNITWMTNLNALIKSELDKKPTVDAEPVVHAHWEIMEYQNVIYTATCSNCKIFSNVEHNFEGKPMFYERCPHCGAKMDEEVDDG